MSHRRSVRFKLTLWYLAVLAVGMAAFGAGTWLVLRQVMLSNRAQALDQRLLAIEQFIENESRGGDLAAVREEAREYATGLPAGHGLRVWTPNGDLLYEHQAAGRDLFQRRRQFTARGHVVEAELSVPLEDLDKTLSVLRWVMIGLLPVVIAIAALGGWWLARRALLPVDKMTREARSISARDLTARVTVPSTGDELQRLAEAWNELLSRIESSVRSVTQFTADAAHELRTPVAVIRASADLAVRQERTSESYRQTLRKILRESAQMTELLDELLLLVRGDTGQWQFRFDAILAGTVVGAMREAVSPLAEAKQIVLEWNVPSRTGLIWADESALRRLVMILIDNAVKFTPEGGRVALRFEAGPNQCVLEVEDSGIGISPEHVPHIFDRFYRADRARTVGGGVGLGLAIARTIVEGHQGTIEALAAPGGGALFRVVLPSVAAREPELACSS
ncbi:MAG: HAMP domain-containing protein [Bryobacterales bacterium]|nr:HAMP domain-containing protein [Bryobacterales bacterium]